LPFKKEIVSQVLHIPFERHTKKLRFSPELIDRSVSGCSPPLLFRRKSGEIRLKNVWNPALPAAFGATVLASAPVNARAVFPARTAAAAAKPGICSPFMNLYPGSSYRKRDFFRTLSKRIAARAAADIRLCRRNLSNRITMIRIGRYLITPFWRMILA
jgi:hypothetical protein